MSDLTKNLRNLSFESGLSEGERESYFICALALLRAQSADAHTQCFSANFFFQSDSIQTHCANKSSLLSGELRVGIVGMGHLGKQLLLSILDHTKMSASNIKVSTRRPENAGHVVPGVEYFFDNARLAQWTDVLFLCCLPSHLPRVCADLGPHLCTHTLVYTFSSDVPISRLVQLLRHKFVLKSQYDAAADSDEWMTCTTLNSDLKHPSLIKLSCPLSLTRKHNPLGLTWVCAVLNSLVNVCTAVRLRYKETLHVMNRLFKDKLFLDESVFSTSSLSADEVFPWISVSDAQETPLYCFLLGSKSTQECFCAVHCAPGATTSNRLNYSIYSNSQRMSSDS